MNGGQALTLALLALAGGCWWLVERLLGRLGLDGFALPLGAAALALVLTGAEWALQRLRPSGDTH